MRNQQGQVAVGYILTIAAVSMGVAAILYGPQIRHSFSLLYTDASTRVIESGPVGAGDVKKAQEDVWGSADLPPSPPPVPASPPTASAPVESKPWADGSKPSAGAGSPAPTGASSGSAKPGTGGSGSSS
ncbi:MAG: hypothetical protein Q7S00_07120, partial [bacterium]|nr:hypothetical protein [bacterium]